MRPARRRRAVPVIFVLLAAVSFACASPTEMTLTLTTDVPCTEAPNTAVAVGELGPELETRPVVAQTSKCSASGWIGTLVVVPSGSDSEVGIRVVTGLQGKSADDCRKDGDVGCIVARRAIRFLHHRDLQIPIAMNRDCLDIPCDPTQTCIAARCVDALISDPQDCTSGYACGPSGDAAASDGVADGARPDGGDQGDATVKDAAVDGMLGDAPIADAAGDTTVRDAAGDTAVEDVAVVDAPDDRSIDAPGDVGVPTSESGGEAGPGSWSPIKSAASAGIDGRSGHFAWWTGSAAVPSNRMIVWGGTRLTGGLLTNGGVYDPAQNTWTAIPTPAEGIFVPSLNPVAVFDGSQVIAVGGYAVASDGSVSTSDQAAAYDFNAGSWSALKPFPLAGRTSAVAVWATTTNEMIVWGGDTDPSTGFSPTNDGAAYDPSTNTWRVIPSCPSTFAGRASATAVWDGTRMIVYGGKGGNGALSDAAAYNPKGDSWETLPTPSLSGRAFAIGVRGPADGDVTFFGGGDWSNGTGISDGAYVTPASQWSTIAATAGAPVANVREAAFWPVGATDPRLYVWGGSTNGNDRVGTGAEWDPATQMWTAMPTTNAPSARFGHSIVWTGAEAIVWGGDEGPAGDGTGGAIFVP